MVTRIGILTRVGIFSFIAASAVYFGKKDIANHRDQRHKMESDALVDSVQGQFYSKALRPGMREDDEDSPYVRESKYVGSGVSYSSRRPGDRLTLWNFFNKDRDN